MNNEKEMGKRNKKKESEIPEPKRKISMNKKGKRGTEKEREDKMNKRKNNK